MLAIFWSMLSRVFSRDVDWWIFQSTWVETIFRSTLVGVIFRLRLFELMSAWVFLVDASWWKFLADINLDYLFCWHRLGFFLLTLVEASFFASVIDPSRHRWKNSPDRRCSKNNFSWCQQKKHHQLTLIEKYLSQRQLKKALADLRKKWPIDVGQKTITN